MKFHALFLVVCLGPVVSGWAAEAPLAEASATNAAPARRAQFPPPVRSPEVGPDGRVTFRLRAAKAAEVVVTGAWADGRAAMTKDPKDTNDVWSVTVGPIEAGVHEYSFQVDGMSMIDPGNPAIKPMREPRTSILHLPGQPPLIHDFQDVPHGVVHQHAYFSKSLGRLRELAVYTPPGYDKQTAAVVSDTLPAAWLGR